MTQEREEVSGVGQEPVEVPGHARRTGIDSPAGEIPGLKSAIDDEGRLGLPCAAEQYDNCQ